MLKWCPLRNEIVYTVCTVTRVTGRRSTRGHCRQDIPLVVYDRKKQKWTLRDKTDEISYLLHLGRKRDDLSLTILDRIRSVPWKSRSPNLRMMRENCGVREDQWKEIPQSPSNEPPPSPQNTMSGDRRQSRLGYPHMVSTDQSKTISGEEKMEKPDATRIYPFFFKKTLSPFERADASKALRLKVICV